MLLPWSGGGGSMTSPCPLGNNGANSISCQKEWGLHELTHAAFERCLAHGELWITVHYHPCSFYCLHSLPKVHGTRSLAAPRYMSLRSISWEGRSFLFLRFGLEIKEKDFNSSGPSHVSTPVAGVWFESVTKRCWGWGAGYGCLFWSNFT